jgi:photoactive yellow protein
MLAETRTEMIQMVDTLSDEELDALPVGVIQLDAKGTILKYNETESHLARENAGEVVGKNFFNDVATCTRVQEFHGRFLEGVERRELNATFKYRFRFRDERVKDVTITMAYRPESETVWVFVERP